MGQWKVVLPETTTNKVKNPSAETTGNHAALGGATVSRSTTYSRYGSYSFRVQTASDNDGISLTLDTLTNAIHYVTLRVRGTLPTAWDWSLDNATYTAPTLIKALDSNWSLYGLQFSAGQANGSTTLYIRQNGAGSGDFYLDGIQAEAKSYWTTFCDGEQSDCEWNGSPHSSTSTRDKSSRNGGRLYDLSSDLGFAVEEMSGAGMPPVDNVTVGRGLQYGAEYQRTMTRPRPLRLRSTVRGSSLSNYHSLRQALIDAFGPRRQAVLFQYWGATVVKEIRARYDTGLPLSGPHGFAEAIGLQMIAEDNPFFEADGEVSVALDTNDSATFRIVGGRIDGAWNVLGPPNSSGLYATCQAIAFGPDKTGYFGGNFTNFDNIANADYIVARSNSAYAALGTGMNGIVYALVAGPDGSIYAGGAFTTSGGTTTRGVAKWNGSAWVALGPPSSGGTVLGLAVGFDGILYAVGTFTNWNGDANGDRVVKWDGSAWSTLSTGSNDEVYVVATAPNGDVYFGGNYTTIGGVSANRIAKWDGSAFTALGSGCNGRVRAITFDNAGNMYVGGDFDTADGVSANGIAKWNGVTFEALGSGVTNTTRVNGLAIWRGNLVAVGNFSVAGGVSVNSYAALWNGSVWHHLDMDMGGTAIYAVAVQGDDLYLGWSGSTPAVTYAGNVTVDPTGTAEAYTRFVVGRSGGTSAKLLSIQNEITGKKLLFNYDLLDGETLTIDLRPGRRSMVSSFWGDRWRILPNSDVAEFLLLAQEQTLTAYVAQVGSPTITAFMLYKDTYWSVD